MNKKHDREKVLRRGLSLFYSKGYRHAGMDEICRATGMAKGAFYNAYDSKEKFLLEVISCYGQETERHILSALNNNNGEKAITRLKNFYINMLKRQDKMNYAGCMVNNMMSELGVANELVAQATSTEFDKFLDAIEPCVREAQADGDLNKSMDSRELTEMIHATFYGSLTRARSLRNSRNAVQTMTILIDALK